MEKFPGGSLGGRTVARVLVRGDVEAGKSRRVRDC